MKTNRLIKLLESMDACHEAIEWTEENNITTLTEAWAKCDRGDWMLWFAGMRSGEPEGEGRKKLVLAACECARLALPKAKSPTVLTCIETVEKWCRGEATIERVVDARMAADLAASAAYAVTSASASAAYAVTSASAASAASAAYAAAAASAAYAAAAYAAAAAAADERKKTLKQCADIVRKHYPKSP